ncbi:origin recognition complex subunit 3 NDAI_0C02450 [Naumovozyma dairenensis CBS 421]|uniref:Uncharacterized protein n=1 Tax=Naumovozyma dairenensis (strain ATCC 10597 / BCRC 20456 / CBS 421 / NBRC 0211 / NRRL Y-12639) TaxID=1071378 RepID=G0W7Z4_NAUDC|nr:hypothetical protein NDAI_0C02450 [Naumovozyma dairenensis CBS 421]CCD23905.1 hypothetical protein NDAI_0C02450 [Naumovozyma dairenensis CBS 421]
MSVNAFADTQKGFYTIFPKIDPKVTAQAGDTIPFVKLLNGHESATIVARRWDLYNQLHSQFHDQVDGIVENIENDLKTEISNLVFDKNTDDDTCKRSQCFNSVFLLGSDSTIKITAPPTEEDPSVLNAIIDMDKKECPNVRMMLRRAMFKLFSIGDTDKHKTTGSKEDQLKQEDKEMNEDDGSDSDVEDLGHRAVDEVSYDLSLVANFKDIFHKNLNLIFNIKELESINLSSLDSFLVLLKSTLKYPHVKITFIFNISSNLSNIEKNLKQSTIRLLKKKYSALDISSNRGFKYANRIFQSFLDTVEGKLNLSDRFIKFILTKMANNSNHNLKLLTKMLDYSLMSYFYQNPFSVFIDPINTEFLTDEHFKILRKCPTFMFFIEGLINNQAPRSEILGLLSNQDSSLEEFFVEFLVRENPINGHVKFVANILENELNIKNYNLIELYYSLLTGELDSYLERWPACEQFKRELKFEPIDTIFQELFTLDNNNGLLSQAIFPLYKSNMEDDLLLWERVLPPPHSSLAEGEEMTERETIVSSLEKLVGPITGQLFKLYREANSTINIYDFYRAFKSTMPEKEIMDFVIEYSKDDESLSRFIDTDESHLAFEKITLILFMQAIFDFDHIGLIKEYKSKNYNFVEKCVWRGI